ncbi:flagellin [Chryseomicrobium aureum]|uniref:flagellin N-terminal helical domain-containing protein n=1 Tax=Chryseomicrobium aureum TaxID=1441723 RepID=UPI00370D1807
MRISHQMLHNQSTQRIEQNMVRMTETFAQASSGKKSQRPSDAPGETVQSMKLKHQLADLEQYKKNQGQAELFLDEVDNKLQSMSGIMQRINELGVQANNDALFEGERDIINNELTELTTELQSIVNFEVNGEALFSKDQPKVIQVAKGTSLEVTLPIDNAIGDLFTTLADMKSNLSSNQYIDLDALKAATDQITDVLAVAGARKNRLESIQNRLEDTKLEQTKKLSSIEGVDMAEVLTRLKSEEATYQAGLAATSRLYSASLVDYLK